MLHILAPVSLSRTGMLPIQSVEAEAGLPMQSVWTAGAGGKLE